VTGLEVIPGLIYGGNHLKHRVLGVCHLPIEHPELVDLLDCIAEHGGEALVGLGRSAVLVQDHDAVPGLLDHHPSAVDLVQQSLLGQLTLGHLPGVLNHSHTLAVGAVESVHGDLVRPGEVVAGVIEEHGPRLAGSKNVGVRATRAWLGPVVEGLVASSAGQRHLVWMELFNRVIGKQDAEVPVQDDDAVPDGVQRPSCEEIRIPDVETR